MRTFTTKLAILAFLLILSLKPTYAQEIKIPDVHDGTWLLMNAANYRVTIPISPTVESTFTIGTTRSYRQIGNPTHVTEVMSLQDPSQPILTIWNEEKTLYYALLVDRELKIGTQLDITIDNNLCLGSWTKVFVSVAPAGPVVRWWTRELINPAHVIPKGKTPLSPAPLSSPKQRNL